MRRYNLYGDVCSRAAIELRKPEVADFFAKLIQRFSPKSYPQALAEAKITQRFLENFSGDSVGLCFLQTLETSIVNCVQCYCIVYMHLCNQQMYCWQPRSMVLHSDLDACMISVCIQVNVPDAAGAHLQQPIYSCACHFAITLQRCTRQTALKRQVLSPMYLAHHELESKVIIFIITANLELCLSAIGSVFESECAARARFLPGCLNTVRTLSRAVTVAPASEASMTHQDECTAMISPGCRLRRLPL